jgi:site-specific recombinase XerD
VDMTQDMTLDIPLDRGHLPATIEAPLPVALADQVSDLQRASKAANTLRAYGSDLRLFADWCARHGRGHLPATPETVAAYVADHAGLWKVSTLARRVAAISTAHRLAGLVNPCATATVSATLSGLRRANRKPRRQAAGLLRDDMRALLDHLAGDTTLAGWRDRALLLVGWCAGLRRSELGALTWGQVEQDPGGLRLLVIGNKTDKTGEGRTIGLAYDDPGVCPVRALLDYRAQLSRVDRGLVADSAPVFPRLNRWGQVQGRMSGQAVAAMLQRRALAAGLVRHYTGHSLRVGLVQEGKLQGVEDSAVMATTGHKQVTMLRTYQGDAGVVSRAAHRGLLS